MSETAVAIVHGDGRVQINCLAVPLYGFLVPLCWDQDGGMGYGIRTGVWDQDGGMESGQRNGVWDQENSLMN